MAVQTTQQKISINVRNYVIDDRGLANTSAIEPKMYLQESLDVLASLPMTKRSMVA